MRGLRKILGYLFPPYKFKVQRQEWTLLLDALINNLPDDYTVLKEQRQKTNLLDLTDWALFPGFKFITTGYPGTSLNDFKKRGKNFQLSGQRIFSRKLNDYTIVDFIIHDNFLAGLKIENSNYEIEEFDLKRIQNQNIEQVAIEFPSSEVDLFYAGLDDNVKSKLNPDDIFDIDFNHRTFFAFYDLEDGNYLAADKKLNIYSLVHDARPMVKKLKYSFEDILIDIETKNFDKDKHLEERFKDHA